MRNYQIQGVFKKQNLDCDFLLKLCKISMDSSQLTSDTPLDNHICCSICDAVL